MSSVIVGGQTKIFRKADSELGQDILSASILVSYRNIVHGFRKQKSRINKMEMGKKWGKSVIINISANT